MKIRKLSIVCALFLSGMGMLAQDANNADLQTTAAAKEVREQLDSPDGAAIFMKPDGSFQILARGTGTYDFDDVDDINDARREGSMKAKAALAKFMKEKLFTEDGFMEASKKVKSISSDGETQTSSVSKESVKESVSLIRTSADALLKGVITLKEQKIPRKGDSGEIQVTVGVSSKTLQAVGKLVEALDATPEQGQGGSRGRGHSGSPATGANNKSEVREAVTDF